MKGNRIDIKGVGEAGRHMALEVQGQTWNSFFQIETQGIVSQSPSTRNKWKCDCEGPDDNPRTNAALLQPGVDSEIFRLRWDCFALPFNRAGAEFRPIS